ncbi:MAG: hypothetical protein QOF83_3118 [Solirubrobacteraceae bacterium]|nr:hypothetical protein [Solirubrobacteraceae bacterium]
MVRPPDAREPTATSGRSPEGDAGGQGRRGRRSHPPERLRAVWAALPRERRLAAAAAVGLVITLFLPWYQETVIAQGTSANLRTVSASLTGWGAFSFVEAAVLLVGAAVITLLFVRAEGAAFHVPGGDGGVVTAAGIWTCLLIVWRMFDKEGTTAHGLYETASGIEWGIFLALGVAALLVYAGTRIKLANEPEPPLPGEGATARRRSRRAAATPAMATEHPDALAPEPDAARRPSVPPAAAARRPSVPPAAAPSPTPRRVRPSSLSEPPATRDRRPPPPATRDRRPPPPAREDAPTEVSPGPSERRTRAHSPRPHRGLDFTELEQITFDDPPEAPTVRRAEPEAEDPLTTRLDRPD